MRSLYWAIAGAALGTAYVLLAGLLNIKIIGSRDGAVFDLNNELVSITEPRIPGLAMFAAALLSGLVFYVIVVGFAKRAVLARVSAATGFVVVALTLVVWSFTITSDAAPYAASSVGIALGWEGWLQEGGPSQAVHLVIVLALGGALRTLWSARSKEGGPGQMSERVHQD